MKKIICLILITVICCAYLFSCGNTEDTGKLSEPQVEPMCADEA